MDVDYIAKTLCSLLGDIEITLSFSVQVCVDHFNNTTYQLLLNIIEESNAISMFLQNYMK